MSFDVVLQVLNLPIFGGVAWMVWRSGYIERTLQDHDRRLADIEDPHRRRRTDAVLGDS